MYLRNNFQNHFEDGHPAKLERNHHMKFGPGKHLPGHLPGLGHKHPPAPMLPAIAEADSVDIDESLGII